MPLSPVKLHLRERVQRAPRPSQSDRRQHHPLHLIRHPRSKQHPQSEPETQEVPSPPQAGPPDVSGQTTDPVDLVTSSVVSNEQTIAIPPQGKVPIIESLPMISSINTIVTLGNF